MSKLAGSSSKLAVSSSLCSRDIPMRAHIKSTHTEEIPLVIKMDGIKLGLSEEKVESTVPSLPCDVRTDCNGETQSSAGVARSEVDRPVSQSETETETESRSDSAIQPSSVIPLLGAHSLTESDSQSTRSRNEESAGTAT